MRHQLTKLVGFASTCVLATACTGDLEPGTGNDPGTGTSTLFVNGEIDARPRIRGTHKRIGRDTNNHSARQRARGQQPGGLTSFGLAQRVGLRINMARRL